MKTYIKTIEERLGGKLNRETLEIEKKQEFKDGDVVVRVNPAKKDGTRSNREFVLYYGEIDSIKKIN